MRSVVVFMLCIYLSMGSARSLGIIMQMEILGMDGAFKEKKPEICSWIWNSFAASRLENAADP